MRKIACCPCSMPRNNGSYKHATLKKRRKKLSSNTLRIQVCKTVRIKAVEKGKTGKQRTNSKYLGNTPYYAKLFQGYFLEVITQKPFR